MRQFTAVIIGLILAALLLGLARPAAAAGETTALQAFIDAQAGQIATLTTRVAAAEATEAASQKRIAALEAWVKAYVPPVASTKGTTFTILGTCSTRGCTPVPLGTTPAVPPSAGIIGTPAPTTKSPMGTSPTMVGTLGSPPILGTPHP